MKRFLLALTAVLALAVFGIHDASAGGYYRGGYYGPRVGVGVGVYYGGPFYRPWGPYWGGYWGPRYWGAPYYAYPYPYYYPAPTVVVPASPPVYVERQDQAPPPSNEAPAQPAVQQWWYWCPGANGYYPYVKECAGGWQRVEPQAPPPS